VNAGHASRGAPGGPRTAKRHFQLHPEQAARTRFLSTGGAPSPRQLDLLDGIFLRLPPASRVVAAVDADEAGEQLARRIEALARGYAHLTFARHAPAPAKDWNDVLQQVERAFIRSLPLRSRPGRERGR
jgi:uncharacterized protein YndB with AHSA1/START domain